MYQRVLWGFIPAAGRGWKQDGQRKKISCDAVPKKGSAESPGDVELG